MPFDLRVDKIETQHCAWLNNKQTNKQRERIEAFPFLMKQLLKKDSFCVE